METRLFELYKSPDAYTVVERFKGSKLEGLHYNPVFPYFVHLKEKEGRKVFVVLNDTFITTDQGTGVVHQAPYFNEVCTHCVNHVGFY